MGKRRVCCRQFGRGVRAAVETKCIDTGEGDKEQGHQLAGKGAEEDEVVVGGYHLQCAFLGTHLLLYSRCERTYERRRSQS